MIQTVISGLQIYFDRWQIEVNHREEKDTLGIGQAQLWNPTAIPKQPALAVAAYSALMLAALKVFGAGRGSAYAQLPRWRRNARRPSCLDLITLLRKEACEHPHLLAELAVRPDSAPLVSESVSDPIGLTSFSAISEPPAYHERSLIVHFKWQRVSHNAWSPYGVGTATNVQF